MDWEAKARLKYEDMIRLPHHVSKTRPQMTLHDRAAQFMPFAALTGYGAVIKETERLTEEKIELEEDFKTEVEEKLQLLKLYADGTTPITATYFVPDEKKSGGAYVTVPGILKRIDEFADTLDLTDGKKIPIRNLLQLDSPIFDAIEPEADNAFRLP